MDWKLFVSTFAAIFVAELGDKTQLATFALAGSAPSRWTVFAGAALALVATTAIAVVAGAALGRYVPAVWLKRGAGVIFVVLGIVFLLSRPEPPGSPPDASQPDTGELAPADSAR